MKYLLLLFILLLFIALTSCLSPLEREIKQSGNPLVEFQYLDNGHILAKAKRAVWFAEYQGDTILLNKGDSLLLYLPDDEYNVSFGAGNYTIEKTF